MFFFFNDTATTEIYTLSLHDALPIFPNMCATDQPRAVPSAANFRQRILDHRPGPGGWPGRRRPDRKSTRLNSSHQIISYAVFCLKKKKNKTTYTTKTYLCSHTTNTHR